jgi:type IV secretory pathway VirB2 component (pilin)
MLKINAAFANAEEFWFAWVVAVVYVVVSWFVWVVVSLTFLQAIRTIYGSRISNGLEEPIVFVFGVA